MCGAGGTVRWSAWAEVTSLVSGRARILTEAVQAHSPQISGPLGQILLIIGHLIRGTLSGPWIHHLLSHICVFAYCILCAENTSPPLAWCALLHLLSLSLDLASSRKPSRLSPPTRTFPNHSIYEDILQLPSTCLSPWLIYISNEMEVLPISFIMVTQPLAFYLAHGRYSIHFYLMTEYLRFRTEYIGSLQKSLFSWIKTTWIKLFLRRFCKQVHEPAWLESDRVYGQSPLP